MSTCRDKETGQFASCDLGNPAVAAAVARQRMLKGVQSRPFRKEKFNHLIWEIPAGFAVLGIGVMALKKARDKQLAGE